MKIRRIRLVLILGLVFFMNAQASENTRVFSLHLGATRVVYNQQSSGEALAVINDHNYPMLVQSEVLTEDKKESAPFVITPPLFRLDALQSSRLRVVRIGGTFPADRETLQWICVKGIPPKANDRWAENDSKNVLDNKVALNIHLSVTSCIKLFFRPLVVKGHPEDVAGEVRWQKIGDKLKGINPTPFYINLSELKFGGEEITERHYIAPFSSYEYLIPKTMNRNNIVQWKVVTDYGGISKQFEAKINKL
ncbi:aggregative adherence fimbria II chaperone AafD [Escherichia coli]|uniref:aggregative adherence fimbria II chaperone AafD n=1 Tax=Escherichia coli TaxID=562 RepID=UPI0004D43A0F|nr:aggregative adherence fimbria II chaperone AafD [Escherichia coli]EAA1955629.1 molecular chaperone [Escherichia coli]EAB6840306.1 aggregative adherence fimbria II chaperone AafD [Escherichia coli]EER8059147.1 aggregative adherence fimbria II chaperone AafD [Escherichia coli]EES2680068.1 aggregative adherence fimbria II chaperone AafD [Escherichia coli]EEW3637809.1 aggregative adherence fimbria II chaperone AafD [Escherichia coli]